MKRMWTRAMVNLGHAAFRLIPGAAHGTAGARACPGSESQSSSSNSKPKCPKATQSQSPDCCRLQCTTTRHVSCLCITAYIHSGSISAVNLLHCRHVLETHGGKSIVHVYIGVHGHTCTNLRSRTCCRVEHSIDALKGLGKLNT